MTEKRFTIQPEPFGNHSACLLVDSLTAEYVRILPSLGGTINQIGLLCKEGVIPLLDGYQPEDDLPTGVGVSFKGSNLFPFPNRVAGGSYQFGGRSHQLTKNFPREDNAIHGLVFDQNFETGKQTEDEQECCLTLCYEQRCPAAGYPFSFRLEHDYRLHALHGFTCTTRITNNSTGDIPVGHGWHPYFTLGADTIDDLVLSFPARELLKVDNRNIPTGESLDYRQFQRPRPVGDTVLDSCFRLQSTAHRAEVELSNKQNGMSLVIWQETGRQKYNFLQVYTPPERTAIALEPMSCAPDAFNNGDGLIRLAPDSSMELSWGISSATR